MRGMGFVDDFFFFIMKWLEHQYLGMSCPSGNGIGLDTVDCQFESYRWLFVVWVHVTWNTCPQQSWY